MKSIFYIDGFNLYKSRLQRQRAYRWLNVVDLSRGVAGVGETVSKVNFYTAYVSGRIDPDAVRKQQAYLRALKTLPEIEIFCGKFNISDRWVKLCEPPDARPAGYTWPAPAPSFVKAAIPQEKGSDVMLASHLLRDAFLGNFDAAYVLSNDTDLVEPIRIATQELGKVVNIVPPIMPYSPNHPIPAKPLKNVASGVYFIDDNLLENCQFADEIVKIDGGRIFKPSTWC